MKKHTPVTLRRRKLPSGLTSLYLDIYDRGERSYEYLRLYLQPETNREAKAANRETLRLAEDIAARRLADILEERRTGKKVARMTFAELYDEMMDERKGSNVVHNVSLRRWAAAAGIEKPLTFHSARHTFACLLLEADVDIYTVSKLLGHATVATTQIYAKIADKAKKAAVERLSELTAINHTKKYKSVFILQKMLFLQKKTKCYERDN